MHPHPFDLAPIAREIWTSKYRFTAADGSAIDADIDATWMRIANAAAGSERGGKRAQRKWAEAFGDAMRSFEFLPAGRIIAGAGTGRRVTLFNCFVMGRIEDDLGSIFENVREAALTMQQGGGIGHDFSTLRPHGAPVRSTGSDASGPVSFMDVWDAMCLTIMSSGARRGAMMGTLRCDHPDIELFIDAKSRGDRLRNFNLSVLVTDAFVDAVRTDAPWPLVFGGKVWRTVPARGLWERLMRSTFDSAEPGVIFIDRINARNNLAYCEEINATNPCGEQPLPNYGACLLGSINLARLVRKQFSSDAHVDMQRLGDLTRLAVRFLDNCIEISRYPLPAQKSEAKAKRRIGLGVTGLADALIMLGQRYGSPVAVASAEAIMSTIQRSAYSASAELAEEKGVFPLFDREKMLARPNLQALPTDIRNTISRSGLRNGCLTSIAPTGTISLLAGNVSSGVEPVFDFTAQRRVKRADGGTDEHAVADYAYAMYLRKTGGGTGTHLPSAFVTTADLTPRDHLSMQAALQRHVDSSISKTINCPADMPFEAFKDVYLEAFDLGLKGCTTFRPNAVTGAVLSSQSFEGPKAASGDAATAARLIQQDVSHRGTEAIVPPDERTESGRAPPHATVTVASAVTPAPVTTTGPSVVYMSKPLERDQALAGFTYKLSWPGSDHAIYVTINDIERDGRRRPFEIFINTRNLEHYAWTVALTRMISAVFRRGGDVSFVVEELKAIFDPQGGHWVKGRYVPSLLAAIGEVIEGHLGAIGMLQPASPSQDHGRQLPAREALDAVGNSRRAGACPRCERPDLVREEGCWVCRSCGYSRCG